MAIVVTLGLIGMIIKNGIVLMDEITLQINQGVEPVTALIDSSQSRLRPVMMATRISFFICLSFLYERIMHTKSG